MPLNLKSIENLLIQKENRPDLLSIVVEYIRLPWFQKRPFI